MRTSLGFALALGLMALPAPAAADTATRLLQLVAVPGVAGYEQDVREAIEMLLPPGARVRADNLGNIVLRTGQGAPHTLIVAPLDESGFVVSAITEQGYLRVHRHTSAPLAPLATQYAIGQPVVVRTASGGLVPGVTATPSTHLRGFRDRDDEARVRTLDDIWIDVGVESRAEVAALGVRLLDSVSLRERATRLAGGRVSGVAAGSRAAALALAEVVRRSSGRGAAGTVTLAWVAQSEYGQRGLLRLLETGAPDRLVVLRSAPVPAPAPVAGERLGAGPLIAAGDSWFADAAPVARIAVQPVPPARLRVTLPERWQALPLHVVTLPVLFAQTPVETVDAGDVDALAALVAAAAGLGALSDPSPAPPPPAVDRGHDPDALFDVLRPLIESYGVSGHEAPVREQLLRLLPAWATPNVDERGNVTVSFGAGGKPIVFVAHMDEVGFEITDIAADGSASMRTRGGMYLSVYEAHPVMVVTANGLVPAVIAPRAGYATAAEAQPQIGQLALYFGTGTAAETAALGVAVGQSATVRKQFAPLAGHRATGRSMDDRTGSAALLLALRRLDPATVINRVTFAWTVEEETGLAGAAYLATRLQPDTAFAVDTFVSSDTAVDVQRLAGATLGGGAVLRVLDSRTIVPPAVVERIVAVARADDIPLQLGTTSGGTDASAFSAGGAIDAGLSWPGRYSHSPVEVMDRRDLEALVRLIVALASRY